MTNGNLPNETVIKVWGPLKATNICYFNTIIPGIMT